MKVFHCDHCDRLVFFENTRCVSCERTLAFLPDLMEIASLEPAGNDRWSSPLPEAKGRLYRLCQNYRPADVCNWAIVDSDPNPLCESCRLTRVIPDLNLPGTRDAWYRLEMAKRRVIYTLMNLIADPLGREEADAEPDVRIPADNATGQGRCSPATAGSSPPISREADDASGAPPPRVGSRSHANGHLRHEVGHH